MIESSHGTAKDGMDWEQSDIVIITCVSKGCRKIRLYYRK